MNSVIHVRVIISAGGTGGHIYPALSILKNAGEKAYIIGEVIDGNKNIEIDV